MTLGALPKPSGPQFTIWPSRLDLTTSDALKIMIRVSRKAPRLGFQVKEENGIDVIRASLVII